MTSVHSFDTTSLRFEVEIKFRLATLEDLPLLEWYGQFTHFRLMFQSTFDDQEQGLRTMLLADLNGFPIGQVFILHGTQETPSPRRESLHTPRPTLFAQWRKRNSAPPRNAKRGYLYALRVMDHLQGKGIGTELLKRAEDILRYYGCGWSSISVAKDNPRARKLYERTSYHVYKEDQGQWSYVNHLGEVIEVHEPCWMLEKRL